MNTDQRLKSGPFTVLYQNGFLRYVRYGNQEIVRMIYFALRDENWGTYKAEIENEQITLHENSFTITYDCYHRKNEIPVFHWKASINGTPTGEIIFSIEGKALTNLLKNRAGFCVLHPIKETVGQRCEIIHADGSTSSSFFPEFVASENPFRNISEFSWAVDNNWFELQFVGDVFETEDQRNWTDASFKTFCTPLDLPFPVSLKKDDTITQKIIFKSRNNVLSSTEKKKNQLRQVNQTNQLAAIGIGASTETDDLTPKAIALLRELKLSHYRIEVYPLTEQWVSKLTIDFQNARLLNLSAEIALHLSEQFAGELQAFTSLVLQNQIRIKCMLLYSKHRPTTDQALINCLPDLKKQFPTVLFGAGTDCNFAELNRNRFDPTGLDFITFAIQPQEHAYDDLSLMETIEAQADVLKSAQAIYKPLPMQISPVTLRKRFNPYANSIEKRVLSNDDKYDPRQLTTFASDWTDPSITQLVSAGACSITLYQTVGRQGVMSVDGDPYPVYKVLKKLSD